jgi:hypothetical protein
LSFYLDAFLFFGLGVVLFASSRYIEKRLPRYWHRKHSVTAALLIAIFFDGTSVSLYLDSTGTGVVYKFLKFLIGVEDPNGTYIMLHTNVTNLTSADMPWYLLVILFALYPFWVYLGFSTANHFLTSETSNTPITPASYRREKLKRFGGAMGVAVGGCVMLFGLVRFPGGILRQSDLTAFSVTMLGIGILLFGVTLATSIPTIMPQPIRITPSQSDG